MQERSLTVNDRVSWVGKEDILFRETGDPPLSHIEIYTSKVQWAATVGLTLFKSVGSAEGRDNARHTRILYAYVTVAATLS